MQHLTLQDPFAAYTQALAERIINVMLTILKDAVRFQKHARIFSAPKPSCLWARLSHRPKWPSFAFGPEEERLKKNLEAAKFAKVRLGIFRDRKKFSHLIRGQMSGSGS